jgi:hypothetical protein
MKDAEVAVVVYPTGKCEPVGWKYRRAVIEWDRVPSEDEMIGCALLLRQQMLKAEIGESVQNRPEAK